jgi:pyruvate/2-oxoglutarate dehydrogenase complex dihydrolipoamide acyltransferase (E2) component
MVASVYLPNVGMGISEATLVKWLKAVGDRVEAGETVAEIETAKSTVEVEAPVGGTLSQIHFAEDTEIAVGTEIATIEDA